MVVFKLFYTLWQTFPIFNGPVLSYKLSVPKFKTFFGILRAFTLSTKIFWAYSRLLLFYELLWIFYVWKVFDKLLRAASHIYLPIIMKRIIMSFKVLISDFEFVRIFPKLLWTITSSIDRLFYHLNQKLTAIPLNLILIRNFGLFLDRWSF